MFRFEDKLIGLLDNVKVTALTEEAFNQKVAERDESKRKELEITDSSSSGEKKEEMESEETILVEVEMEKGLETCNVGAENDLDAEAVALLADELVAKVYGQFFEFNDSEVKPMTIAGARKAFEGRDSAYLVVYRNVNIGDDFISDLPPCPLPTNSNSIIPSSSLVRNRPEPPQFWQEKADEMRLKLEQQRALYTPDIFGESGAKFDLKILFPVHFDSSKAPLFPRRSKEDLGLMTDYPDGCCITGVDPRKKVSQLQGLLIDTDIKFSLKYIKLSTHSNFSH